MDIFDKWACDPIFEALFVELSPIDPHTRVLREVMNAVIGELVIGAEERSQGPTYAEK